MIIWSGFGILVFIFLLISGWLTSYSFDHTGIWGTPFIAWTMIWASIPTFLLWLGLRGASQGEQELEPGEIPVERSKYFTGHSFMFIPVLFWGPGLLIWGIYILMGADPEPKEYDYSSVTSTEEDAGLSGERIINFWNPTRDSLEINTTYADDGRHRMTEMIKARSVIYGTYKADHYRFEFGGKKQKITVKGATLEGENTCDETWYVMDHDLDLVLMDVTVACSDTMNKSELTDVDWMSKVEERYKGGGLIEPKFSLLNKKRKLKVYDPGFTLPTSVEDKQIIYALIPIYRDVKLTEEYLDSCVIDVCF